MDASAFDNVMIDLETVGTRPGSAIVSIGAVLFGSQGVFACFYRVISMRSSRAAGLSVDDDTLEWWKNQSPAARDVLKQSNSVLSAPVARALAELSETIGGRLVWSNGADFDLPILAEAYWRCGLGGPPWSHKNTRCYRTIRALRPEIEFHQIGKLGGAHNALDDAASQAEHAVQLLAALQSEVAAA